MCAAGCCAVRFPSEFMQVLCVACLEIDCVCSLGPDGFPPFTGREKAHVTQFSALVLY